MVPKSKRLVIDTDIISSASESTSETSVNCRRFLETVREFEHQMVISPDIWEEWKVHRSGFASRWLTSMYAQKLVHRTGNVQNPDLQKRIAKQASDEKVRGEVLKDVHLLEAALVTDGLVTSRNERERKRFARISRKVVEIRKIVWANPDQSEEKCLDWLREGAPADEERMLGYNID